MYSPKLKERTKPKTMQIIINDQCCEINPDSIHVENTYVFDMVASSSRVFEVCGCLALDGFYLMVHYEDCVLVNFAFAECNALLGDIHVGNDYVVYPKNNGWILRHYDFQTESEGQLTIEDGRVEYYTGLSNDTTKILHPLMIKNKFIRNADANVYSIVNTVTYRIDKRYEEVLFREPYDTPTKLLDE